MPVNNFNVNALSGIDVVEARKKFGNNELTYKKADGFIYVVKNVAR